MNRTLLSLASILSFRMLGLFMIFPVFSTYAIQFNYATPSLVGIALGAYGLTQALLQLPLSTLSDRLGRKPVIVSGLILLILGSIVCALTTNIYLIIFGRALQGAGAIGSTIMAATADMTTAEDRTKAMAILGMTIGVSFGIGMIIGPLINAWFHLSGIFWLTAILGLLGIVVNYMFVPSQKVAKPISNRLFDGTFKKLLLQWELLTLNLSILILHAIFTANFVVIPLLFAHLGVHTSNQWQIYLPVLLVVFIFTLPLLIVAEKKNMVNQALLSGIIMIGTSEFLFYYSANNEFGIIIALAIFLTGFTSLEALLPSLVSKTAPAQHKGSAMGIFSTFQFFGIFMGGAIAGTIQMHHDNGIIFAGCVLLCAFWLTFMLLVNVTRALPQEIIRLDH